MASSAFRESVDLLGSIRSILENYPFSVGLLREILQNTDDAGAIKQIFVLDYRTHPHEKVCDPRIVSAQGPALLAFNNASFLPEDWKALQNISRSSKKEDTSKIGKFGIGIRSCYHVTDFLQILSGESLVIFDPQRSFSDDGGIRFSIAPGSIDSIRDHFLAFSHFLPAGWNGESFNGTVVRLPLRSQPGEIREKTVSPHEIKQLFDDFIRDEINISMLFLQHLRSIQLIVIDRKGNVQEVGACSIDTAHEISEGIFKKVVLIRTPGNAPKTEEWLVMNQHSPVDEALTLLTSRAGTLSEKVLLKHKLRPDVGLAFPLDSDPTLKHDIGQLFTFLRLPLATGFPAHVHALFALTPSRQNLRNHAVKGVVKGYDDHILLEWNKILFEVFIPRAWSQFLATLAKEFPTSNIFSAWPSPQSLATCGESIYWKAFPQDILKAVLDDRLPVWPELKQDVYLDLERIFVASPDTNPNVLEALAAIGLSVCRQLPRHIFNMISAQSRWSHRVLTPENVSRALRDDFVSQLGDIDNKSHLGTILQYLLSSNNLANIIGLPIVPTVSGRFVALSATGKATVHTLLERRDAELFRLCDGEAIDLSELPAGAAPLFEKSGPATLNVKGLNADRVVEYLALHPTRAGSDLSNVEPNADSISFISHFWRWVDVWPARSQLVPRLDNIKLLPCLRGWECADRGHPVIKPIGITQALSTYLSNLGVPFLVGNIPGAAQSVLEKYGYLKSVCDIHALLDRLEDCYAGADANEDDAKTLMKHFNQYMVKYTMKSFSDVQATTFKRLPIFPVVEYRDDGSTLVFNRRRVAVDGLTVYGTSSYELLPILPNTVFVDLKFLSERLLPILNESHSNRTMSDMDILSLTFGRLDGQPKRLLAKILQHIASRSNSLTLDHRGSLKSERYIYSASGSLEMPETLIDPLSPIHDLYVSEQQRLPRREDDVDRQIVPTLQSLKLLDNTLSANNILDRIRFIAQNPLNSSNFKYSITLLKVLYDHGFPCNDLRDDQNLKTSAWLPAQKGCLVSALECRPGQGTSPDELYLFDCVLELVHSSPPISSSLRKTLGWDDPIPVAVLIRQLGLVLDPKGTITDVYQRIRCIIRELGKRNLASNDLASLKSIVGGRAWVPTSEDGTLVESWRAVFTSPFPGIYTVASDLRKTQRSKDLLIELGCLNAPSFETVTRRLAQLRAETTRDLSRKSSSTTALVIAALRFAVSDDLDLTQAERSELLVPDDSHQLRPIRDVVFNDVGSRAGLVVNRDFYFANSMVDYSLAKSLNLERLGLKYLHLSSPGEDMGVTTATIVEKNLAQYTNKQFLSEFLANAEDAGASQLVVIVNAHSTPTKENFLSPAFARLHSAPSVMVYNDKEFSKKDFEGICRTSIGSKAEDPDSIGQFGLGALTMFHITECAIIYSGDQVLFLDPSKTHLPLAERASLLLPLSNIIDWYPGQTVCLRGLEYYDQKAKRVNGTIFLLPLRHQSHYSGRKPFIPVTYDGKSFQRQILDDFRTKASDCLLFIKLSHIEARVRSAANDNQRLWSFTAHRTEAACDGFNESAISIEHSPSVTTREWLTVTISLPATSVPSEYKLKASSKNVRVGLAAPLNEDHQYKSKFFSTLPLAVPAVLPVHVNASFMLSSDRRQIRLDKTYNSVDTQFNLWLLTAQLPPLYLALLERIARDRNNSPWWPGTKMGAKHSDDDEDEDTTTAHEDALTSVLTTSFYSKHLPKSMRRVFYSMYRDEAFKFSEATLYSSRIPSAVRRSLGLLQPPSLTKLSSPVRARLKPIGIQTIEPKFIKEVLLKDTGAECVRKDLEERDLVDLLAYLSDPDPALLRGLPLLLLGDQTWATFQTGGTPYYSSRDSARYVSGNLLPANRFASYATMSGRLLTTLSESKINVEVLDAAAIKGLVEQRLGTLDASARIHWTTSFWEAFDTFPQNGLLKSIETLALVPGIDGTSFKSLLDCKNGNALLTDTFTRAPIRACIQGLGIFVIAKHRLPSQLGRVIGSNYTPQGSSFLAFLRCINPILTNAIAILRAWPTQQQETFAEWIRNNITSEHSKNSDTNTARRLPVWTARKGIETRLCSANELNLLPAGITIGVGTFSRSTFLTEDGTVSHLGIARMTVAQLYNILQLPSVLPEGHDEATYRALLPYLLTIGNQDVRSTITVPNGDRRMVRSNELFERNPFFAAAFGSSPSHFLLGSFDIFSSRLDLIRQANLDATIFGQCVKALHDDAAMQKAERGRVAFRAYCEDLPLHIPSNRASQWHTLDQRRFIPRSRELARQLRGHELELPAHIRAFPDLVSPREVVQSKFYAIAWTQRVGLAQEPSGRLLTSFPDFGCPSGAEVIAHLKALRTLGRGPIVLHDLKETYKWLDRNIPAIETLLVQLGNEGDIFLNVDDATKDEWRWSTARQMALETDDLSSIQRVCDFLQPFRRLLKAAGVLEVVYPEFQQQADDRQDGATNEQTVLKNMREGFVEMRSAGQYTDVVFLPEPVQPSEATAEDDIPVDRRALRGHRVFLSVCNAWFHNMFTGSFRESQPASSSDPLIVSLPTHSEFAIKTVLDYLYTGKALEKEQAMELDDLMQTLQFSHYTEIWSLFNLVQKEIVTRKLVNPDSLPFVQSEANLLGANALKRWCDEYEQENLTYIRAHSQDVADSAGQD